jgi:hypothetical protein
MFDDDIETLKERKLCFNCVGEEFLSEEIRKQGKRAKCDYCGKTARQYNTGAFAERVDTAFERHYTRTSTEPDAIQWMMMKDKESDYDWEREGEPLLSRSSISRPSPIGAISRSGGQGEPASPATSSEAGSNRYVVILPDNGRDPEVTEQLREQPDEYFARTAAIAAGI